MNNITLNINDIIREILIEKKIKIKIKELKMKLKAKTNNMIL